MSGILQLQGFDCPVCKNKGYTLETRHNDAFDYDYQVMIECPCKETRKTMLNIKRSGLSEAITTQTFENFEVKNEWQQTALTLCRKFESGWLLICGQVGAGKSHLGTATMGKFLKQGKNARYMLWRDESVKLKSLVNDFEEYSKIIDGYKKCDVLYIDDFFKTERDKRPTQADINLAHELLNYRYINRMITIISSELLISDILNIDEAVGSRIYEMSKNSLLEIGYDKSKNWRLR